MTERERAFLALRRVERQKARADLAVAADAADEGEKAFLTMVVRGAIRWRPRLDYLIETLARRNVESIDPDVATLLRVALYELLEMDAPAYAVVNEHVATAARRFPRAKGFVNAVLRGATRVPLRTLLPEDDSLRALSIRTGHPEWMLARWVRQFGRDRASRIAAADQERSYPDLLVNTGRIDLDAAEKRVAARGVEFARSPFGGPMLRLFGGVAPLEPEIAEGLFYPMDEGSWLVSALVRSGPRVLDVAAAPGGKSLALAMRGLMVVAHDVSLERLQTLRRTHPRFFGREPRVVAGDATRPPFRAAFDTVLVDAPCSATGTLRKNPEVRLRLTESDLGEYARRQLEILRAVAPLARDEIVYATCSLEPEENREVVDRFLDENAAFRRVDLGDRVPENLRDAVAEGTLLLTPEFGTDGFSATLLRRREPNK